MREKGKGNERMNEKESERDRHGAHFYHCVKNSSQTIGEKKETRMNLLIPAPDESNSSLVFHSLQDGREREGEGKRA